MRLHRDDFIGIIGELLGFLRFKQPKKGDYLMGISCDDIWMVDTCTCIYSIHIV